MGKVIASITTSVDGYVTGADDGPVYGLGRGGERLHYWVMGGAAGIILALVVDDLDAEYARLRDSGVEIAMPLREEEWGECLFQVVDSNGLVIELGEWES